jgi:hypothetical protein
LRALASAFGDNGKMREAIIKTRMSKNHRQTTADDRKAVGNALFLEEEE